MASVRSTIELIITGSTRGLGAAAAEARAMAERIAAAEDRVSDARRRSAEADSRVAESTARLNAARSRLADANQAVSDAENRTTIARTRSQISTAALGRAEDDLNRLRASGVATTQQLADADTRVTQARAKAVADARNLATLEQRLDAARRSQGSSSAAVTALEERLARARGQQFRASEDLARAENNLNATRRRGTADMNRQRDGILGIFDALGRLADAFSGADGASTSLLSKLAALNSVISSIGGPIVQAVIGILEIIAVLGALGEIIGVVGGLIGQALAGVPVLLFAIGAAAGTVMLGLDGIKKAAEVMAPAFEKLKAAISGTFQRELTPVFRDLAGLIPKLTSGFQDIAVALSGVARQLVSTFTSTRGVEVLNQALAGTANLIRGLGPGVNQFFSGLTQAAAAAAPAMTSLGAAIGGILGKIGEVLTKLAANGTIQAAITGLAATFQGLGDLIGPIIELFIRMGAALGGTVGSALTRLGGLVQSTIPFFEKLADVAGRILAAAFDQLGPSIERIFGGTIPSANAALDQFANFIINTVLPKVREFVDWLSGPGLAAIQNFVLSATASFLQFVSDVLTAISSLIPAVSGVLRVLSVLTGDPSYAQAAAAIDQIKVSVDGLNASVKAAQSKIITFMVQVPEDRTTGERGVLGVAAAMDRAAAAPKSTAFTVRVPSDRTTGEQGILGVVAAQSRVTDKTVTTTANVPGGPTQGTLGNQVLEGAIGAVIDKSVTTTSQVPGTPVLGTQGNQALKGAIDQVRDKNTTTLARAVGEDKVRSLKGAIDLVKDKTVTISVEVKGAGAIPKLRARGGPVLPRNTYLVGEEGPELLTMGSSRGFVTDAQRTRQLISPPGVSPSSTLGTAAPSASSSGDAPITVNVMLSQDQIAGIAQVEIARRDRATKRTVLAGSGVTF